MTEAYLDIETTGLSPTNSKITVIGIHIVQDGDEKFFQLIGDQITADNLVKSLEGVTVIHTYNGSRFDLPFIEARLGVDLTRDFAHCDLMYDCWQNKLYGGLKRVERTLGIPRKLTEINGLEAVRLWWRYENDYDQAALKTLCDYNREDVVNLKYLKEKVGGKTYERKLRFTPETRNAKIESYGMACHAFQDVLRSIPDAALDYKPSKSEWSIREIIHHLADAEANAFVRCRRIIAEPGTRVLAYDQNKWAEILNYKSQSISDALALFKHLRANTYALLNTLPDKTWFNTVEHSEAGIISLEDWLDTYETHSTAHLEQIKSNIRTWKTPGTSI